MNTEACMELHRDFNLKKTCPYVGLIMICTSFSIVSCWYLDDLWSQRGFLYAVRPTLTTVIWSPRPLVTEQRTRGGHMWCIVLPLFKAHTAVLCWPFCVQMNGPWMKVIFVTRVGTCKMVTWGLYELKYGGRNVSLDIIPVWLLIGFRPSCFSCFSDPFLFLPLLPSSFSSLPPPPPPSPSPPSHLLLPKPPPTPAPPPLPPPHVLLISS